MHRMEYQARGKRQIHACMDGILIFVIRVSNVLEYTCTKYLLVLVLEVLLGKCFGGTIISATTQ